MTHRSFNIVSLASAAFALFAIILWLATFAISPWDHWVSFTDSFHVSVWSGFNGDSLGRLVIFNDDKYGPYRGSIMAIGGEGIHEEFSGFRNKHYCFGRMTFTNPNGTVDRLRLCDLPGIYFRDFDIHGSTGTLWTLMIGLWYPLVAFSILPAIWIFRRWLSRHKHHMA
jgi:hypothetical protein